MHLLSLFMAKICSFFLYLLRVIEQICFTRLGADLAQFAIDKKQGD